MIRTLRNTLVLAFGATLLCTGSLVAQDYTTSVVLRNLEAPTGIFVAGNGDLLFTEVPTPGMSGMAGGRNSVSRYEPGSMTTTVIGMGEPEPLNITMINGVAYWTCRTAGVIFREGMGPVVTGLAAPTGLAGDPNGDLIFTEVPTPGVNGSNGGSNTVSVSSMGSTSVLSMGEPEPVDVTRTPNGNLYWTCRTAGVILRRDAGTGALEVVLRGLDAPTGIASDGDGVLYFTEVPTPGISGPNGGENEVWRYDPRDGTLSLVSRGEPEPVDVAVSRDGNTLYWTCRTAGVIVRGVRNGTQPSISSFGRAAPGRTTRFFLDAPAFAGQLYQVGTAEGLGASGFDSRFVGLASDALLSASVTNANTPLFSNYFGILDLNGMGTAQLALPMLPSLSGRTIYTAFAVLDPSAPSSIAAISETVKVTID